ncbi:MAG: hypothetical protein HYX68_15080 [Planctomycetes bacterium]|nr:hypothetical protein [Planctomycetota bacterium]
MGRMLDTLKFGEGRRAPLTMDKPVDATPVQDCVVDWEIGAEVPFVEVGGPGKKVELSPGLQVHPPQPASRPPHLPGEIKIPAAAKSTGVYLTEPRPLTAAFEPWPAPAPALLTIPSDVVACHQPDHPASKQYADLLGAMLESLKANTPVALLLSGLRPNVGTGTVLLNLAATAALRQKSRVAVVDLRGSLAERLSCPASSGLAEVLAGTLALDQAIMPMGIPSLNFLGRGKSAITPGKEVLAWILGCLRARHDVIFVHGPTADAMPLLGACASQLDAAYLVLPHGEPAAASHGIAGAINGMGGRLGGLIHTHFE